MPTAYSAGSEGKGAQSSWMWKLRTGTRGGREDIVHVTHEDDGLETPHCPVHLLPCIPKFKGWYCPECGKLAPPIDAESVL
jgi:hypothetical protein